MAFLEKAAAQRLIDPTGPLSRAIKGFEIRPQQQKMMEDVLTAYNKEAIAFIEAGTGTGKTIAYLLPALLWAMRLGERTVIATHTIALQEQLIGKDIPLLLGALGIDIKVALVKGMGNYLCLRKLSEAMEELLLAPAEEQQQLHQLEAWRSCCHDGSRASIPFAIQTATWERINAEADSCSGQQCPFFSQCYFFNARKSASDAQVVVTNHSLFFADIALRATNKQAGILPPYTRVVIDEAHHLEEVATEHLAAKASSLDLLKQLARLGGDKQSKLNSLQLRLFSETQEPSNEPYKTIQMAIAISLPGQRRELIKQLALTFHLLAAFTDEHCEQKAGQLHGDSKLRLLPTHLHTDSWKQQIAPQIASLADAIDSYAEAVDSTTKEAQQLCSEKNREQLSNISCDILALTQRLRLQSHTLRNFTSSKWRENSVRWMERRLLSRNINVTVVDAALDLSRILAQLLFTRHKTIILCSATLTANNSFHFMKKRLGITKELLGDKLVIERIYSSPFDFRRQTLFVVPNDMPAPHKEEFLGAACERIYEALMASRGNAFVLFTSYQTLLSCFERLKAPLTAAGYQPLKQGAEQRRLLLERFKAKERSVLFGTDSFWEGVDVIGDALRCVIIVKLPFKVPTEPIIQARTEAVRAAGGNPFFDFSLPCAIIKFIQGVGRLVRHRLDRGCIVCLDNRLIYKSYGKQFLSSLPPHALFTGSTHDMRREMEAFYKKTYYLAKQQGNVTYTTIPAGL